MRWLVNKVFRGLVVCFMGLCLALPAGAETWHWQGKGVSGNADVKVFHSVRMAAVDQIIKDLGYTTEVKNEELLVRARTGLRFVRGAAMAWLGYGVISLPARTRVQDGHWWVETDAALRALSQFLKKNGKDTTLRWNGTGSRNNSPSKKGVRKRPPDDKGSQTPLKNLPSLQTLRWGGSDVNVRAVCDLKGQGTPQYRVDGEELTVSFAPLPSAAADSLKSPRSDIFLSVKNGKTAELSFRFPGRIVSVFTLKDPWRLVADFKAAPGLQRDDGGRNAADDPTIKELRDDRARKDQKTPPQKDDGKKPPKNGPAASRKGKNAKKIVVIDPGHGGKDPGAMAHGYREKVLALQISKRVTAALEKRGVTVRMTRTGDTYPTLRERTAMANKWNADVFVSIHLNALPKGRHSKGVEIYLMALPTDKDAMMLAKIENTEIADDNTKNTASDKRTEMLLSILGNMQQNAKIGESTTLAEELFTSGRASGLNMKRVAQAPFWVLRGAGMPAVLIETGFITELAEVRRLAQPAYQQKLAEAIATGIMNFIHK